MVASGRGSRAAAISVAFVCGRESEPFSRGVNSGGSGVNTFRVPFWIVEYEKLVPTGWSIYSMFTWLFHEYWFSSVLFESSLMLQGKPDMESSDV